MATFKAEVYTHHKKKDGTYNIKIRVYHNGEKKYLSTPYFIKPEHLSQRGNIKSPYYKQKCEELVDYYRMRTEKLGVAINYLTCERLVEEITKPEEDCFQLNFIKYWSDYVEHLKRINKTSTAGIHQASLRNFERFIGKKSIDVNDINTKLISKWMESMQEAPSKRIYTAALRAVYNRAKNEFNDEDLDKINISKNPFKKVTMPKNTLPKERCISTKELLKIINYNGTNKGAILARDIFMLSFYLLGTNIIDLYYCDTLKNGRLEYCRAKTKSHTSDNSFISIKLEPEVEELMEKYKDPQEEFVFNFARKWKNNVSMRMSIVQHMYILRKELGIPNLVFYSARHTWASIAYNECGIDKYVIHQALNHSLPDLAITDIYIKKDFKQVDIANRKVLDYIKSLNNNTPAD